MKNLIFDCENGATPKTLLAQLEQIATSREKAHCDTDCHEAIASRNDGICSGETCAGEICATTSCALSRKEAHCDIDCHVAIAPRNDEICADETCATTSCASSRKEAHCDIDCHVAIAPRNDATCAGEICHDNAVTPRSLDEVHAIIEKQNVSQNAKQNVKGIFALLAKAECLVHGETETQIHFHEIGSERNIETLCQICQLIENLAPSKIDYTPINLGCGTVHCSHGTLPVPAPATKILMEGMKSFSDGTKGELTTPSGIAVVKYFCN